MGVIINKKGYTIIELMVVITIIGILAGATVSRLSVSQQSNNLDQTSALITAALVEAKQKRRAPVSSGSITEKINAYGYGVHFDVDNNEFFVFKDIVDSINPENQGKWVDPLTTDNDDEVITRYKFSDYGINNYKISSILARYDSSSIPLSNKEGFVFRYSEIPSGEYLMTSSDLSGYGGDPKELVVVVSDNNNQALLEVIIDYKSSIIKTNYLGTE
jgi:prepilin-type N-terminal cleavage/methylation domain-containing protein